MAEPHSCHPGRSEGSQIESRRSKIKCGERQRLMEVSLRSEWPHGHSAIKVGRFPF
jgi:hypothetical protein